MHDMPSTEPEFSLTSPDGNTEIYVWDRPNEPLLCIVVDDTGQHEVSYDQMMQIIYERGNRLN